MNYNYHEAAKVLFQEWKKEKNPIPVISLYFKWLVENERESCAQIAERDNVRDGIDYTAHMIRSRTEPWSTKKCRTQKKANSSSTK